MSEGGVSYTNLIFSVAIYLFGALLRLRTWHCANIEMIVPDSCRMVWCTPLKEWAEAVGVAKVWSASEWAPQSGVIWRGNIRITKQKVCKKKYHQC